MSNYSKFAKARRISRADCKRNALLFSAYYNAVRLMLNSWTYDKDRSAVQDAMTGGSDRLAVNFNNGRPARAVAIELARAKLPALVDWARLRG